MSDRVERALVSAVATLVEPHDISGSLAGLLSGIRYALEVDDCGTLAANRDGVLEVLSVSSHAPAEQHLFEMQAMSGPAIEALSGNRIFAASGAAEIGARWPELSHAMLRMGHETVLACPLRWDNTPMGAVVVFSRRPGPFPDVAHRTLQAFADLSMLVVMHSGRSAVLSAAGRIEQALDARVLIEQAKGVVAHEQSLTMGRAYDFLQAMAIEDGLSLTDVAARVVALAGDVWPS